MPLLALTALAFVPAALGQGPICECEPFKQYEITPCTTSKAVVCAECTICPKTRYQKTACTRTADATCSEEVRPLTEESECLPKECIFPFKYRGLVFHKCTGIDLKSPNLWCSKVDDFDHKPNPNENFQYCDCRIEGGKEDTNALS